MDYIQQSAIDLSQLNETPQGHILHSAPSDEDYLLVGNYVQDYLLVGNYVEDSLRNTIGKCEYEDFAKLMPKDKIGMEEDHRMEMVNRGGFSYWIPVADCEVTTG